jgi:hypothetical protein
MGMTSGRKGVTVDIVCPWWKRPEITELHAWSMQRFMKAAPSGVSCKYWAILSPEDDPDYERLLEIARHYRFEVLEAPNRPVASKLNHGIYTVSGHRGNKKPDSRAWIMNIGSDDLVDPDYWKLCYQHISEGSGHLYAVDRLYICDESLKNSFLLKTFNPGALRFIRLWAIQALKKEYELLLYPPEINRTMDGKSAENLAKMGIKWQDMIDGNVYVLDVKTKTNITNMHGFMQYAADRKFIKISDYHVRRFFPDNYKVSKSAYTAKLGIPSNVAIRKGLKVAVFENKYMLKAFVVKVDYQNQCVYLKAIGKQRLSRGCYSFHEIHLA